MSALVARRSVSASEKLLFGLALDMVTLSLAGGYYRVGLNESVKKGKWYIGVLCHACGKPILPFPDAAKGKPGPLISGPGGISMVCNWCGHDDQYAAEEIKQMRATRDVKSYKDRRPTPSNASRQPLSTAYRRKKCTFGVGAIEQLPEFAKVIARIAVYWTHVETQLARLLSVIMQAGTEPAIAVYLSLRNARAKNDALEAAGLLSLEAGDYELFQALLRWKDALEKERNDVVHGMFGVISGVKDAIAWVSTAQYATSVSQRENNPYPVPDPFKDPHSLLHVAQVYRLGTLERIAREIETLNEQIGLFLGYLKNAEPAWRAIRYPQLCSEPHVRKALDQLRQHPKNTPSGKP